MSVSYRRRRIISVVPVLFFFVYLIFSDVNPPDTESVVKINAISGELASKVLGAIVVKGRAPKTDYSREQFGGDWESTLGCDTRNIILNRDLISPNIDDNCNVVSGTLDDPYTGKVIEFKRGSETSSKIQIDHVVALSDAWQKGAQNLTKLQRIELANDPLELLAVDGAANQQKSGSDAASWLPANKPFRCQYVARQIAIKRKYNLWITSAERDAMSEVLSHCPNQTLPKP